MSFYSQEFQHLKVQLKDHVLWVHLDNEAASNAITLEMADSLTRVLYFAEADNQVRAVVVTGQGNVFCAGGDVKDMKNKTGMFQGEPNELRLRYIQGIQRIPVCFESLSKPVIAMVNGAAVGAGCDLAMMCDIRIGSEKSKFGETFVKLGLIPGDGGAFLLQRVVGYSRAMQMSLTGDLVSGKEAQAWGLLNYCVEESMLLSEVEKLAARIANNAPVAVQMTKRAIKHAYRSDLSAALDLAASFQGIAQRTEDHFLGVEALLTKKPAQFQGR